MIRTLAPVLILALLAAPAAADDQKTEQWIGSWSGKATSKGCVEPAPKKLTFDVALTHEGGLRSNGDVIFEGWGDLDWKVEGKALTLVRDGMSGTLKLSKKTLKLSLRTDGACVVTATLKRTSSGIASCDRVRALATIKSQCAALPSETRGQTLADVEAGWSGWAKLKGKKKTAQGKLCTEQVAALENETKACAAVSGGPTGIKECDEFIAIAGKYYKCNGYTDENIKAMNDSWIAQWKGSKDPAVVQTCKQALEYTSQALTQQGCAP